MGVVKRESEMWEGRLGGISFMMMMRKRPWPLTIVVHTPGRGGPYALTCAVVISQRSQEKSDWIQKRRSTTLERGEIEVRRSSHGPALIKTVLTLVLLFKHRGQLALGLIDPHVHIFCHILQCLAGWHIPNTRAIHTLDQSLPHKWHQQLPRCRRSPPHLHPRCLKQHTKSLCQRSIKSIREVTQQSGRCQETEAIKCCEKRIGKYRNWGIYHQCLWRQVKHAASRPHSPTRVRTRCSYSGPARLPYAQAPRPPLRTRPIRVRAPRLQTVAEGVCES